MNQENVVVDERIERLRFIAKSLIINYLKDMYGDKQGIEVQLARIEQELMSVNIVADNRISGSPTLASNNKKGKVTLRFKDKDNISNEEVDEFLETLIHEFYHSVSKSDGKDNAVFLEEGYVTYITAQTIRHSIEHLPEIEGVDAEQLRQQLKAQELKNGYEYASEFVRTTQLVMGLYGYDSTYEYMLSNNGTETLAKIASEISPVFEKILRRQVAKTPAKSPNLTAEKMFLKSFFDRLDFEGLDRSSIEMNDLLQKYLVKSGIAIRDSRLKSIMGEMRPELVAYQELIEAVRGNDENQRRNIIEESVPHGEMQWPLKESIFDTVKQMTGELKKFYDESDSKLKCRTFGNTSFYALAICYDMIQKGAEVPTDDKTMQYLRFYDSR